jgi:hypothetical protein
MAAGSSPRAEREVLRVRQQALDTARPRFPSAPPFQRFCGSGGAPESEAGRVVVPLSQMKKGLKPLQAQQTVSDYACGFRRPPRFLYLRHDRFLRHSVS